MDPSSSHQINQLSYKNVLIFERDSSRRLKHDFILPETHLETKDSEDILTSNQVPLSFTVDNIPILDPVSSLGSYLRTTLPYWQDTW